MFQGADILRRVKRERPLIHHLTNFVTMHDCASVTANIGALPVMSEAEEEVEEMVASAKAAVINTGTITSSRVRSMLLMGRKAREMRTPVVFDPVGAGATVYRTQEIRRILAEAAPLVVKGNAAEIGFLAGAKEAVISGVQSLSGAADCLEAARRLQDYLGYEAVIAVTGPADIITDGRRTAKVFNGHAMLPRVVGSGCMAASVIACFAAVEKDYFIAAAAAQAFMGLAAERAAKALQGTSFGPAMFKVQLLDAFFLLTPETFGEEARVEILG